jgi:hypothetical protein
VDLNDLDESSFQALRQAVYKHGVVVVKLQHDLIPVKQSELIRRFDPEARGQHGFGAGKGSKLVGFLGVSFESSFGSLLTQLPD